MDGRTHTEGNCGIVLISHGNLAEGMLESVQLLLGKQEDLSACTLYPEQRVEELMQQLREQVGRYGADHLLILSDMQYGSPFNAAVALALEYPQVHHITGMNLPVVLAAVAARNAAQPDPDMDEICGRVISETAASIVDVRRLLAEKLRENIEEEDPEG